jgi:two-component system phosphate regulon sensor histidine kinase PhoR
MRPEPVSVKAVIEDVLEEARALSGGQHTITASIDGPDVVGSAEELRSAFANLASNAVRYTPPGGTVNLIWKDSPEGPQFTVSDTGIGIDQLHIVRLTERFYRVDKSRSRETQGTGLGLAIVKHVLLRHRANLTINSVPGKGSCFTVTFPKR